MKIDQLISEAQSVRDLASKLDPMRESFSQSVEALEGNLALKLSLLMTLYDSNQVAESIPVLLVQDAADALILLLKFAELDNDDLMRLEEALGDLDHRFYGARFVARILGDCPLSESTAVLQEILKKEPESGEAIIKMMFTFDDFLDASGPMLKAVIEDIDNETAAVAFKAVSTEKIEKTFGCLDGAHEQAIRAEMQRIGNVRIVEAEEAQRTIVRKALRSRDEGLFYFSFIKEANL